MARASRASSAAPATSPQANLAAVIKTARDAMRKDAGLNGSPLGERTNRMSTA